MTVDDAYIEVMRRPVGATPLVNYDLLLIGTVLLNSIGTTLTLGHTRPGNTLDYTRPHDESDHISLHIVRDFIAWTSGRVSLAPGCEERQRAWIAENWHRHQLEGLGDVLGLNSPEDA